MLRNLFEAQKKGFHTPKSKCCVATCKDHHCGVCALYASKTCGKTHKTKHAAQCNVPKCRGPSTVELKTAIYGIYKQALKTHSGPSQRERLIHHVERNAKRENALTRRTCRGPNKEYGKVWQKEDVDIMVRSRKP